MKRFFSALALCFSLLTVLTLWLFPGVAAKEDPIITLLNLPAPPAPNPLVRTPTGNRPPEFYNKTKPPPDNAPIEDLMDYWSKQSGGWQDLGYTPMPSSTVAGRILRELEGEPDRIVEFLNIFQDDRRAADMAREMYRKLPASGDDDYDRRGILREWLKANTSDFSGELEKSSLKVKDVAEYVSNHEELITLTKVDWDRAAPIVNRLYADKSQKTSQVVAMWALYKRAMLTGGSDVDRYRDELKAVVENKEATDAMRDLALDALLKEPEWPGRSDWYVTLLADETLYDLQVNGSTYTGLTTIIYYDEDDKLTERMIDLMLSDNVTVRTAAAKNLLLRLNRIEAHDDTLAMRKSIIESLLPWLGNRAWIKVDPAQRDTILRALQSVKMPEGVPALIAALDEKQKANEFPYAASMANMAANRYTTTSNMIANAANVAANAPRYEIIEPEERPEEEPEASVNTANRAAMNANRAIANALNAANAAAYGSNAEYFPLRSTAISALAFQRDPRAAAPLRRVLPEVNEWERATVVKALLDCGGFTTDERVAALEFLARAGAEVSVSEDELPYNVASPEGRLRYALGMAVMQQSGRVVSTEEHESDADKEFENYSAPEPPASEVNAVGVRSHDYHYMNSSGGPLGEDDIKALIAGQLVTQQDVDEDLIRAMVERIAALDKREPVISEMMRKVMLGWNGAALNAMLLGDARAGKLDPDAVLKLLAIRKKLRETQLPDVSALRTGHPAAIGLAACLLEEKADYDAILMSGADASKIALLACGRLIRAQLQVAKVVPLLRSPNKMLATASERFLESEDSPEARAAILALYPNQAKILGATTAFNVTGLATIPGSFLKDVFQTVNPYFGSEEYQSLNLGGDEGFAAVEKRLQKEVIANPELLGVYAYDRHFIRIYKDKAVFSWEDDPARYRERVLEPQQFDSLKGYLSNANVDKLPPFLACSHDCESKELLMLGRGGGRRVYLKTDGKPPEFFAGLTQFFDEMKRQPAKLKYYASEQLPGLEVLYADDDLSAISVWKQGPDIRVLVSDAARERAVSAEIDAAAETELEDLEEGSEESRKHYEKFYKQREARKFESVGWHSISDGKLGPTVMQPRAAEYVPVDDGLAPANSFGQWTAKAGAVEVRADDGGLHKIVSGRAARIRTGNYSDPVITSNGRWAIATKYSDDAGPSLVRVNLATNREYKIKTDLPVQRAIAFIEARNLILAKGYDEEDHHGGEYEESYNPSAYDNGLGYYLINPDTGAVYPGTGELRPIAQQTFRPLQSTGTPGEFWAAMPRGSSGTLFGTYSTRTLKFTTLLKLPKIIFDSTEMWVDGGKVHFTHEGHLLAVPVPQPTGTTVR